MYLLEGFEVTVGETGSKVSVGSGEDTAAVGGIVPQASRMMIANEKTTIRVIIDLFFID